MPYIIDIDSEKLKDGSKVIIYGIGELGLSVFNNLVTKKLNILFFIDKKADLINNYKQYKVYNPSYLLNYQNYDYIFIASDFYRNEIYDYLTSIGIFKNKILFLNEINYENYSYHFLNHLFEKHIEGIDSSLEN